jgi:hypothetical protein
MGVPLACLFSSFSELSLTALASAHYLNGLCPLHAFFNAFWTILDSPGKRILHHGLCPLHAFFHPFLYRSWKPWQARITSMGVPLACLFSSFSELSLTALASASSINGCAPCIPLFILFWTLLDGPGKRVLHQWVCPLHAFFDPFLDRS